MRLKLLLPLLLIAGCSAEPRVPPDLKLADPQPPVPPRGVRIGPSGYATILKAPPAPSKRRPREQETAANAFGRDISVAPVEALMNPPETVTGGVSQEQLELVQNTWLARLGRLASGAETDPSKDTVRIFISVGRSEFEPVARREGWLLPPNVTLRFAPDIDPATVVAPDVAPFIRAFARQDRAPSIILASATRARIILHDGCFRMNAPDGPLVLFGRNTRLHRDGTGYLTVSGIGEEAFARIGEPMIWGGYGEPEEDEPGVRLLRTRCGEGRVVSAGVPKSDRAFRARLRRD
jgi:hypothetical protein